MAYHAALTVSEWLSALTPTGQKQQRARRDHFLKLSGCAMGSWSTLLISISFSESESKTHVANAS